MNQGLTSNGSKKWEPIYKYKKKYQNLKKYIIRLIYVSIYTDLKQLIIRKYYLL